MNIAEEITKVLAEWHAAPADPEAWQFAMFEDATARIMPLVKRAQAEAWERGHRHCFHVENPNNPIKGNPYTEQEAGA